MEKMNERSARQLLVDIGRRMYEKDFVAANDGNISLKLDDDTILTTPTGVSKGFMTEAMMVKMRMDGTVIDGSCRPSSEVKMHLRIYQENPLAKAVCHAHPPVSTAYAIAGMPLDQAIYPEAVVNLGVVPCVHYEEPGSQGIPDSIAPYCREHNAILLGNHGVVTWGKDLMEAWYRMESTEHYAMILRYTGYEPQPPRVLSQKQVARLIEIRYGLGVTTGGMPAGADAESNLQDHPGGQNGGEHE